MSIIEEIKQKLKQIEIDHDVRILWAIESGSRSWGFESPDSDYDVRFIYVNKPDWYLTILEARDVIELPVNEILDISGWDLRKSLRLFTKSNPTIMEWLVSPFIYTSYGSFRDNLLRVAEECFSKRACSYHYLNMADNNYRRYVQPKEQVKLKKYFYVLRPLLNIIWLYQKNSIPPMKFEDTMAALELPEEMIEATNILLEDKKHTSEIGLGPKIPVLEEFIQNKLSWAQNYCETAPIGDINMDTLNDLFRQTIRESWQ